MIAPFLVASLFLGLAWPQPVWIRTTHTGEEAKLRIPIYGIDHMTLRHANRLFRSWRTNLKRPIHPKLLRHLHRVQAHFGQRAIELSSGYRIPDGSRLRSFHHLGRAADIRSPGISNRRVFEYCRTLPRTGCGYYPNGHHVHIDVRTRSTIWIDLSATSEAADYVSNPHAWLARHPE